MLVIIFIFKSHLLTEVLFVLLFFFLFNNLKVFISLFHDRKNIFISVKHKFTQVKFIIINIVIILTVSCPVVNEKYEYVYERKLFVLN